MSIAKPKMSGPRGGVTLGVLSALALGNGACIRDTDCGICNPDSLVLESISGVNYLNAKIHLVSPECTGDNCPEPFSKGSYWTESLVPCEESEEANDPKLAPRGPQEYCKISPLIVAGSKGLEFVFNNLLEPTSVELVRKRPDQPKLFEAYDWKPEILELQGPITRYNGDYLAGAGTEPDLVSRTINLSCIDNLRDEGRTFGAEDYRDPATNPCNAVRMVDGVPTPMRMRTGTPDARMKSFRGQYNAGGQSAEKDYSCSTPPEGADTCCSECDFLLGTEIAKYGVDAAGTALNPNTGTAITCDATNGDPLIDCKDFIPSVDRSLETRRYHYEYCEKGKSAADCAQTEWRLPKYDKIRETHPDFRPDGVENFNAKCTTSNDCVSAHGLEGTLCVGSTSDGAACLMDRDPAALDAPDRMCTAGVCRPQWVATCKADDQTTGGGQGYCVDRRFSEAGAASCYNSTAPFVGQCDDSGSSCSSYGSGKRLGNCNSDTNDTVFSADECCQSSLGASSDGVACDPFFQPNIAPLARYERDENLPAVTRGCVCEANPPADCVDAVNLGCLDANGNMIPERQGQYAVLFVRSPGGVVYDPAIKGVEWRAADIGSIPRAKIEACAEGRGLLGERNRFDGWRANDAFLPETVEDFDRAMCSGSTYTVVFATPETGSEYIRDKQGNTLEGKREYTFKTPDFHIRPNSGAPPDNQNIGACGKFSLIFSNKYDLSPENLRKLQILRVDADGNPTTPNDQCDQIVPVAGGANCAQTQEDMDADKDGLDDPCAAPCLTVDVDGQSVGSISVIINTIDYARPTPLKVGERYRLTAPGLNNSSEMTNPAAYQAAFWDACGMPLILGDVADHLYDFTIDPAKCSDDPDHDLYPSACDNAGEVFNPDQGDMDRDGFGDVIDLCPTIPTRVNTGDSDKDGVGNECDVCRQTIKQYNRFEAISVPDYMLVRANPTQVDTDEDGIGDVCDNCVLMANCEDYGLEAYGATADKPFTIGDTIAFDDRAKCQRDDDQNLIGDACEGQMLTGAAGPVGVGAMDDFDQDGLTNAVDACPRQPLTDSIACTSNEDCGENRKCEPSTGICDHVDSDGDGVGDICDTCPLVVNPMQIMDGVMQDGDDSDADFIGKVCEGAGRSWDIPDARPFSFYEVSASGFCCTVALEEEAETGNLLNTLTGQPLLDPDFLPIRVNCDDEDFDDTDLRTCRRLPADVAGRPGILMLPPGCEAALQVASDEGRLDENGDNPRITLADAGSADALWNKLCFLPRYDQDYDGLGDTADFCMYAFDPTNKPYIDSNGKLWPGKGAYCWGDYDINNPDRCEDPNMEPGNETGTGGTGDTGGQDTDGMTSTGG